MNVIAETRRGIFFCAKVASDLGEINGQKISFGNVIDQQGAAYDSTTGIFTAPEEGIDVFYSSIVALNGKHCVVDITRNGIPVARLISDSDHANDYHMGGNMVVVHVMTGEKCGLKPLIVMG